MSTLTDRFKHISSQISEAIAKARRAADSVTLVAVSKTHPPAALREALEAGVTTFGENRVQEARAKIPLISDRARWHFIGHLQRNKVRQALPLFDLLHGVDSLEIARDIQRVAGELGLSAHVLLEVNVAQESTKFGFRPKQLYSQLEELMRLDRLHIDGLMAIPPPAREPEDSRGYFRTLRELRDHLRKESGLSLPHLSMGMSNDFCVAIEEGATLVRVGSALFGARTGNAWSPSESDGLDE